MTNEEYLRVCGWIPWPDGQATKRSPDNRLQCLPIAEAVEVQLAEDRARFAFVLARTPQPEPRSCDPGFPVEAPGVATITTPEGARRLCAPGEVLKMQRPVVAARVGEPPDSGPVNDLAAVAVRINKRLNDLWFDETGRALSMGIQKPGAYAEDAFVYVCYDAFCGVSFLLSERIARAYDAWLAAGNVGKHSDGGTMARQPGVAAPLPPHILLRALEALLGAAPTGDLTEEDMRVARQHVVAMREQARR